MQDTADSDNSCPGASLTNPRQEKGNKQEGTKMVAAELRLETFRTAVQFDGLRDQNILD